MNKSEKASQIEDFSEMYKNSQLFVVAQSKGLNAEETTALRKKIHESGGSLRVFKNTFVKKALAENLDERLSECLKGPNTFMFGGENFIDDLKNLVDFSKDHKDKIVVRVGTLDGEFMDEAKLEKLSTLPGKDQLRAQLVGTLVAPIRGLVTVLSGNVRGLVTVLSAIKENKEKAEAS